MPRKCFVCGNTTNLFEIPSSIGLRSKWLEFIAKLRDTSQLKELCWLCCNHFDESCFSKSSNSRCRLLYGAVPTIIDTLSPSELSNFDIPEIGIGQLSVECNSKSVQASTLSQTYISNLEYHCKVLTLKLRQANRRHTTCMKNLQDLKEENYKNRANLELIKKISDNEEFDEKAKFLMDSIKNYGRKRPQWSEQSVRICTIWRYCSPKGYEFGRKHLMQLPSRATISRYFGHYNGPTQLCKDRLCAEILKLTVPVQRICSLIIDDMSIKEKMSYSRWDDHIYGLDNTQDTVIGEKPEIANKMLCFVIHGLSTKYVIPAGYFFHSTLTTNTFHSLTIKVLNLLTDCGYIVLRLVTDNHSSNVALFKKLSGGIIKNQIPHPILKYIPLFLSFDYCHAIKNARSLFLDHDMTSSDGVISSSYLKRLYNMQKGLPVKPVRYLTKKHLFPNNFEKMNVIRAVDIFSPSMTASLRFLKDTGDYHFRNVDATISFMENMYKFFQVHNVSNRIQCIRSLDSDIAPFVDVSDERLNWLNVNFQQFIDDIQNSSANAGMRGLSQETAHALKFTASSTYLCIKYLLCQCGFYYVLTRTFSSDAIEATFSHVRLRGGSQDATDARAAEYALRQILRCGIVKAAESSNIAENVHFMSKTTVQHNQRDTNDINTNFIEDLILPFTLRVKIQNLYKEVIPEGTIYGASIAYLAGYIIKKIDDKFHCNECIESLLCVSLPGPLMKLIMLQDRGGLQYPNSSFVGLVKELSEIIVEVLPYLRSDKACEHIVNITFPCLIKNPIFKCKNHKSKVCAFVIKTTAKPVLNNICNESTDSIKGITLNRKPLSRKVLKL